MDHRASQPKTHRNLMIATLVREVLKGCSCATHGRLGAGAFHGGVTGARRPRQNRHPLRWVVAATAYTSLWPQCSQKRSPVCTVPWHWGQAVQRQVPQGCWCGRRRPPPSWATGAAGVASEGCSAAGLAAGSSAWPLAAAAAAAACTWAFSSGRPSCCSCPQLFIGRLANAVQIDLFKNSHQVSTPTISGSKRRKPKPAQTPG